VIVCVGMHLKRVQKICCSLLGYCFRCEGKASDWLAVFGSDVEPIRVAVGSDYFHRPDNPDFPHCSSPASRTLPPRSARPSLERGQPHDAKLRPAPAGGNEVGVRCSGDVGGVGPGGTVKPSAGHFQRDTTHPAQRPRRPIMTPLLKASNGLLAPLRTDAQCARCARRLAHDRNRTRRTMDRLHPSVRRRIPTAGTFRTHREYARFGYAAPAAGYDFWALRHHALRHTETQRMTIPACHGVKEVTQFGGRDCQRRQARRSVAKRKSPAPHWDTGAGL
jgi:hypothetical protein